MPSQNENAELSTNTFSYFISHNGSILVASVIGPCEEGALDLLNQCKAEIEERLSNSIQGVVLNLSGLTTINNDLIPFWAQLQVMIRAHKVELRLCGIEKVLKKKLLRLGVVRGNETASTLQEALPEIVTAIKKNALSKTLNTPSKKAA